MVIKKFINTHTKLYFLILNKNTKIYKIKRKIKQAEKKFVNLLYRFTNFFSSKNKQLKKNL
jgi:hypothetical protein